MKNRFDKGFTLIELLVVIAITSVVIGMGVTTVAATLRSSAKATITQKVTEAGDLAVDTISREVRNAVDVCATTTTISIYDNVVGSCPGTSPRTVFDCSNFTDSLGNPPYTVIKKDGLPITSGVQVVSGTCNFSMSQTVPKRVVIDFRLSQVGSGTGVDTTATIPFSTEVTLRNF